MNSQIERPKSHTKEDPHCSVAMHSGGDNDRDKKSVLKKVKAKAKKIKETIKGHVGHGGNDLDHHHHEDTQVHGAPSTQRSFPGQEERTGRDRGIDHIEEIRSTPKDMEGVDSHTNRRKSRSDDVARDSSGIRKTPFDEARGYCTFDPNEPKNVAITDDDNVVILGTGKLGGLGGVGRILEGNTTLEKDHAAKVIHNEVDTKRPEETSEKTGSYGEAMSKMAAKIGEKATEAKDVVYEKLKPAAEEKALSQVISEALHKGKESEEDYKVKGRVTESEEIKKRLGPFEETSEDDIAPGVGKDAVHWMKEAAASWFGTTTQHPSSHHQGNDIAPATGKQNREDK